MALITLVDRDRQWFKSKVGVERAETPRSQSFCSHAILGEDTFVITDATADPRFNTNPLVTSDPGIRFYAGQPIVAGDGSRLGTLCVLDRRPRELSAVQRDELRRLATDAAVEIAAGRLKLGTFRVLELIGRGGMGAVYRARDESLGRLVALKLVLRQHAGSGSLLERFRREAQALAAISHPNVLTIFHVGEEHGLPYLVAEHLPGGTLDARARAPSKLPWREVAAIGAQVASGLGAIHEAGLVHRDVKPANILFDTSGRPRVADFGLVGAVSEEAVVATTAVEARTLRETLTACRGEGKTLTEADEGPLWQSEGKAFDRITSPGAIQGTLLYMAPEQAFGGHALDGRADLYSLGATLYCALTGRPPIEGRTVLEVLSGLANERPAAPSAIVPDVAKPLDRLLLKLLEKSPEKRPANAQAVAQELDSIARWQPRGSGRTKGPSERTRRQAP